MICGSDLQLFHNYIPAMLPGDIMGHGARSLKLGSGVTGTLKKGDRIVVPFTIPCGECKQCRAGISPAANELTVRRTWRKRSLVTQMARLFGYTNLTGGKRAIFSRQNIATTTTPLSSSEEQSMERQ